MVCSSNAFLFMLMFLVSILQINCRLALLYVGPSFTSTVDISETVFRNTYKIMRRNQYNSFGVCSSSHRSLVSYLMNTSIVEDENILFNVPDNCLMSENDIKFFFNTSYDKRKNIILASDFLANLNIEGIKKLNDLLNGYSVVVVMSYRNWIYRILQTFTFKAARFKMPMRSFLIDHIDWFFSKHYWSNITEKVFENYSSVFGANRIKIIDTLGALHQGKDTFEVICCDIMKLSSEICDENGRFTNNFLRIKPAQIKKQHFFQLFQTFQDFAFSFHCKIEFEYYRKILEYPWKPQIPKIHEYLSTFAEHTMEIDENIRKSFKLMYNNQTFTIEEAKRQNLAQIDRSHISTSTVWRKEFYENLKKFSDLGFITCSKKDEGKTPI